jgi:hypothetical protein
MDIGHTSRKEEKLMDNKKIFTKTNQTYKRLQACRDRCN